MCISKKMFLNLCDLFPITASNLRSQALQRRHHFIKAMEKQDVCSPLKALQRSMKRKLQFSNKDDEDSRDTSQMPSRRASSFTNQSDQLDEDALEQFYSDEEPKISIEDEETPDIVIKKIGKKNTKMTLAINTCVK